MTGTLEAKTQQAAQTIIPVKKDSVFYLINQHSGEIVRVLTVDIDSKSEGPSAKLKLEFPAKYFILNRANISRQDAELLEQYETLSESDVLRIKNKYFRK